jgi:DNA-damage-inducible protein J
MMFMSTANITFRIDTDLKNEAENLFSDFGLSMNNAFVMFLKQSVREQRIPFIVSREMPNKTTLEAFEEVRRMEQDPTLGKSYSSVKGMMEDILSDA